MERIIFRPMIIVVFIALIKIAANMLFFVHYAGNIRGIQDSFQESLFSTSGGDGDRIRKMKPYIIASLAMALISAAIAVTIIVAHCVGSREPKNSVSKLTYNAVPMILVLWFLLWIVSVFCTYRLFVHAYAAQSTIRHNVANDNGENADDIVSYERLFSCTFGCDRTIDPKFQCKKCEHHIRKTLIVLPYFIAIITAFGFELVLLALFLLAVFKKYDCFLVSRILSNDDTDLGERLNHERKPLNDAL